MCIHEKSFQKQQVEECSYMNSGPSIAFLRFHGRHFLCLWLLERLAVVSTGAVCSFVVLFNSLSCPLKAVTERKPCISNASHKPLRGVCAPFPRNA